MNLKVFVMLCMLLACWSLPMSVRAAFPVKQEISVAPPAAPAAVTNLSAAYAEPAAKPADETDGSTSDGGEWGLISFGCGVLGLLAFIAAVGFAIPELLAVTFLSAVWAIVTGAMSFRKRNKGFGIAGFTLGIVEVLPLTVLVIWLATMPYKGVE